MIENEKKILLTEQEYKELLMTTRNHRPPKLQTNYYFDTYDYEMNSKGITCRIRSKNGKFEMVIKSHNKSNVYSSVEDIICIKNEFDTDVFRNLGLYLQGSLTTERTVIFKEEFCEMVLDYNTYLGQTDFELEIEYDEICEEYVMHLLSGVASTLLTAKLISSKEEFLARIDESKSKSERFFERKQKIF